VITFVLGRGITPGTGVGTDVVDVADTEVEDAAAWIFFSERVEYITAVTPAPVATLTAAMSARVVFDILREEPGGRLSVGSIYWVVGERW
jgi:hypothetical protein